MGITIDIINLVVEKGLDINCQDQHGMTVLHAAAGSYWDSRKTIVTLLDKGADPRVRDARGLTALDYAMLHREKSISKSYLASYRANFDDKIQLLKQVEHKKQ